MNIGIDYIATLLLIAAPVAMAVRGLNVRSSLNWALILGITASSCTIDVSPSSGIVPSLGTATPLPASLLGVSPAHPSPAAIYTSIPVTWSALNLTGSLLYISPPVAGDVSYFVSIRKLDLVGGEIWSIFTTRGDDWIYYLSVSSDAKQLIMSYMPSALGDVPPSRALYVLALDDETALPQLLFSPPTPDDHYVHAEWSPDGKYIYYAHYNTNVRLPNGIDPVYDIFRMRYPEGDGQTEKIAANGFWPRVSPDSSRLVYVSINPETAKNEMYVANADGSNPRRIVLSGVSVPEIIDAPFFSPDGDSIIFSAPPPLQAYQPTWSDALMGVQEVKAHEIPSDWWSVPVEGGTPAQLTQLQTIRLFASLSPDRKHIASLSGEGLFVMDENGSNLTQLLFEPGVLGTVSWIP
jgi:Tol biopolymer transport system component